MKSILRVFSLEVAARDKEDLTEEPIIVKLRKVKTMLFLSIFPIATFVDSEHCRLAVRATTAHNLHLSFCNV